MPNNTVISEGNTTNEAIENGLKMLNVSKEMVNIKVLETDKKSFFSILAPRVVKVELTLKDDKEIVMLGIKKAPWTACYASERLKADRDVIKSSVETYGQTLYFASEKLRDDEEIVKSAVSNKGLIIKYASFYEKSFVN